MTNNINGLLQHELLTKCAVERVGVLAKKKFTCRSNAFISSPASMEHQHMIKLAAESFHREEVLCEMRSAGQRLSCARW